MVDTGGIRSSGEARPRGLARALVIGFGIVIASGFIIPYADNFLSSSGLLDSHFPLGVLIPFLFLVTIWNVVAKLIHRRLVLRADELVTILVVGLSGLVAQSVVQRLMASCSSAYYYGSPENRWPELVWPLLPEWLLPSNRAEAISLFYRGAPPGTPIPWATWGPALVWWLLFLAVIVFVCLCISVILRKQWVDHERVEFPLAQIPLQLAHNAQERQLLPGVFRRKLFWVGFALPAVIIAWRILTWFNASIPPISVGLDETEVQLGRDYYPLYMRVNLFVIGFAYFTRLEILLSIWLFHVLGVIQQGMSHSVGFGTGDTTAFVGDQAQGGLVFFVLWGLWMARKHIRDVFRKAFTGARDVDDAGEYLSYRTAAFGFLLGGAFLWVFLVRIGMSVAAAGLFLLASLIIYLGLAKIIAMSGLVYLRPTWSAQSTFRPFVSTTQFGPGSIVGVNLMYAVRGQDKGYMMPPMMTNAALNGPVRPRARTVGRAMFAAAVLGMTLYALNTIRLGYQHGAANFNNYVFTSAGQYPYRAMATNLQADPDRRDIDRASRRTLFGVGIGVTGLLTFLTYRLPWWPLHPVGFTVSWAWPVEYSFFSVFLAWLAKAIILRVGGLRLYERGKPFFIGLIIGWCAGVLAGLVVDVIAFPGAGHALQFGD